MLSVYLVLVLCSFSYGQLPSYIKPCKKDANLGNCIKDNIEAVMPYMGKGVPKLYLKPLNPWVYPTVKMNLPFLKLSIFDVITKGMDKFVVKDVDMNLDDGLLEIKYNLPYFWGEANYDINGNLFMFQVDAKGYANASISDIDIILKFSMKPRVKRGKNYMSVKKSSFDWKIKGPATIYFKDIFPGNPFLTDAFNRVVGSRAVDFFYIDRPIMEIILTEWIEKSLKGVFGKYSLNELFVQ